MSDAPEKSNASSNKMEERVQKIEGKMLVDEKTSILERRVSKIEASILAAKWAGLIVGAASVAILGIAAWMGSEFLKSADAARAAADTARSAAVEATRQAAEASSRAAGLRIENERLVQELRSARQTYTDMNAALQDSLRSAATDATAAAVERQIQARGLVTRIDIDRVNALLANIRDATRIVLVPRPGDCPEGYRKVGGNNTILVGFSRAERPDFERIWSSGGGDGGSVPIAGSDWIGTHPHVCVRQ